MHIKANQPSFCRQIRNFKHSPLKRLVWPKLLKQWLTTKALEWLKLSGMKLLKAMLRKKKKMQIVKRKLCNSKEKSLDRNLTFKFDKEKRLSKATKLQTKTILIKMFLFWTNANKRRRTDVHTLRLTLWVKMLIWEPKSKLSKRLKSLQN